MLYVALYGTCRCLLSVLRMDLALVTKCVVSAWKGDKGGTVLVHCSSIHKRRCFKAAGRALQSSVIKVNGFAHSEWLKV